MHTGTYFWTRSINSCFNILSHLFLFLILGANIFQLILTSAAFWLDGYLSYIVYVFWQNLNKTKNSSISSSAQSEISQQLHNNEWIEDPAKQLEEEIKAGLANDVLEVDEYDENGIVHTKAIRIDEENKQVIVEWSLPPIKSDNLNNSRDICSKDNASRMTAVLDDGKEMRPRKNSYDDAGTSCVTKQYRTNSMRGSQKKEFWFTSNHVQVVEKSNVGEEERKSVKSKRKDTNNQIRKLVSQRTGSEKRWIDADKEIKNNNLSVSSENEYREPEIFLDNHTRTLNLRKNFANSPPKLRKKEHVLSDNEIKRSQSRENIGSIKSFKFTSQFEWVEKDQSYAAE